MSLENRSRLFSQCMLHAASGQPLSHLGVLARRSIPAVRLHRWPMNAATSQTKSSLQEVRYSRAIHWSRNGNQRPARKSNGVSIDWINLERWENGDLNLIAMRSQLQTTDGVFYLYFPKLVPWTDTRDHSLLTDRLTYGKYLQQVAAPQQILPASSILT